MKYPVPEDDSSDQGVGPHFDGGFLTFVCSYMVSSQWVGLTIYRPSQLLQASPHRGLQIQNLAGEWIDAPPIPNTFVINIGKGEWDEESARTQSTDYLTTLPDPMKLALETVTHGLAKATSHRVLSPQDGSTPRYSIPFFQNISQTISIGDSVLKRRFHILCHSNISIQSLAQFDRPL